MVIGKLADLNTHNPTLYLTFPEVLPSQPFFWFLRNVAPKSPIAASCFILKSLQRLFARRSVKQLDQH